LRANLIEHELVVYVNHIPDLLSANRVLPVSLKSKAELMPVTVSEHCIKAVKGSTANDQQIISEKVSFKCDSDSTNYTVLAGQIDGTSTLNLVRPDNTSAKYALRYSNLRATPDDAQFRQIIDSFQTR
jgi:hypothetical protein